MIGELARVLKLEGIGWQNLSVVGSWEGVLMTNVLVICEKTGSDDNMIMRMNESMNKSISIG